MLNLFQHLRLLSEVEAQIPKQVRGDRISLELRQIIYNVGFTVFFKAHCVCVESVALRNRERVLFFSCFQIMAPVSVVENLKKLWLSFYFNLSDTSIKHFQ